MRSLNYEAERVISLDRYITDLQKDIDDLDWDGQNKKADFLRILLKEAQQMKDQGELWYPLF